jgi:ClpP class serine protease
MEKKIKILLIILVVIATLIIIKDEIRYQFGSGAYEEENTFALKGCNVAGVALWGELFTYYDADSQSIDDVASAVDVSYLLEQAETTPNIDAILLSIDSYGGSAFGAQELVDTIKDFVTIPVIAEIREYGLSAAY